MESRGIQGGYIIIARKTLLCPELVNAPPLYRSLWLWMLLKANYKDGADLKRGQFFTSINEMREAMSYKIGYRKVRPTRDQIRSAYEAFTKPPMITTAKTTRGLIITIVNYNEYQDLKNYEAHNEAHNEDTTKPTVVPHYTKRKRKNIKKEKKENNTSCPELQENSGLPVLQIPLIKSHGIFPVYQEDIDEWQDTFPGIDVIAELKKCRQWNKDNPSRRKTNRGIRRHITTWLSRAQDKPRRSSSKEKKERIRKILELEESNGD